MVQERHPLSKAFKSEILFAMQKNKDGCYCLFIQDILSQKLLSLKYYSKCKKIKMVVTVFLMLVLA
jgi:hypothetical protein